MMVLVVHTVVVLVMSVAAEFVGVDVVVMVVVSSM